MRQVFQIDVPGNCIRIQQLKKAIYKHYGLFIEQTHKGKNESFTGYGQIILTYEWDQKVQI